MFRSQDSGAGVGVRESGFDLSRLGGHGGQPANRESASRESADRDPPNPRAPNPGSRIPVVIPSDRMSRLFPALLCALAAASAVKAQHQEQPPITFRVEVNYVEIDATVVDGEGNPVRDLTREDFTIVEDGRPQTLTVFSRVELPIERPDPPLFRASVVEPDVRTNRREFDGRVFVLVLDDLHTSITRTPRVRAAAAAFIERYLGANDVAAVVMTGGGRGGQEFTSSRPLLLRTVHGFSGRKLPSAAVEGLRQRASGLPPIGGDRRVTPDEAERAHYARNMLTTMKNVADYLSSVSGRRKSVILFSEGIAYDISNPVQNRFASDLTDALRAAVASGTRGNVTFYTVDPRGLAGFEDLIDMPGPPPDEPGAGMNLLLDETRISQDSLRVLAEETGGVAVVNRNDYRDAFERIIRENSSYYVLGYYSDNTRRDGRFRQVQVQVRRPGVTVRARKGYTAPRGNPPARAVAGAPGASPELRDAMASPIPMGSLGLAASAVPFRGGGREASVLLLMELDGSRFRFTEQDGRLGSQVEFAFVPIEAGGKVRQGVRDDITLTPRPESRDALVARGLRFSRRLDLPPGRYSLRVGAREAGSGAVGSVVLDVEVPDFAEGPLAMSGVVVTSSDAAAIPTARLDEALKDVLPGPATTSRAFRRGADLTLYAEVYDHLRTAHKIEIVTSLTRDDGTVAYSHSDTRSSDELKARGDGFGHVRTIPLRGIEPGRYVLRVEGRALVSGASPVARELEIEVR